MPALTADELAALGHQVAHRFMQEGVSLNEGVKQAALDRSLVPEQIARVCERANHATYAAYMADQPTKLSTFPVADTAKVAALIEEDQAAAVAAGPMVPDASDYHRPPSSFTQQDEDPITLLFAGHSKTARQESYKTASLADEWSDLERRRATQEQMHEYDKLAEASRQVRADLVGSDLKRKSSEEQFYEHVKASLLKGESFDDIWKRLALDEGRIDRRIVASDRVRPVMERLLKRLKAENLVDENKALPGEVLPVLSTAPASGSSEAGTVFKQAALQAKEAIWSLSDAVQADTHCLILSETLQSIEADKKAALNSMTGMKKLLKSTTSKPTIPKPKIPSIKRPPMPRMSR